MSGSSDSRALPRLGVAAALGLIAGYVGCGFPDHTFDDSKYYGTGATGVGGLAGGGGTAAGGTGAKTGGGGTGATGGGGTGATGATGGVAGAGATGGVAGAGGTGAGGTGATGGGGTGATGGSDAGTEDCTNGVDDNGDNKIDCADPQCTAGFTCVQVAPSGWTGPVAVYEGTTASPGCNASGGYPLPETSLNSTLNPGNATCQTCTCGNATGATCTAEVVYFDDVGCGGTNCWGNGGICTGTAINVSSTCVGVNLCYPATANGAKSALFNNVTATGGTCTANSSGTKQIPAPTWDKSVQACGGGPGSGKGCGSAVCTPKPAAPFSSLCVYKTGDVACPGAGYTKKTVYYSSFTDNRDCSACSCGSVSGGSCSSATMTFYTDTGTCAANAVVANTSGACVNLPTDNTPLAAGSCQGVNGDSRGAKLTGSASGATCPATGGQITGAATPTSPTTFCCL